MLYIFILFSLPFSHQKAFVELGGLLDRHHNNNNINAKTELHDLLQYIDNCKRNWAIIKEVEEINTKFGVTEQREKYK